MNLLANDRPSLSCQLRELGHRKRPVSIRVGQVLGSLALEAKVLYEADVHSGRPSVGAFNEKAVRLTLVVFWLEFGDGWGEKTGVLMNYTPSTFRRASK